MITKESWGKTAAGKEVFLYTLTNQNGLSVQVTTFGARIVAVNTPDRSGKLGNIIVGPDTLEGFEARNNFFGATIGRYGNRIAGGSFELDGHTYELTRNEGSNTLHGGTGVHNCVWESAEDGEQVIMTLLSPDGTDGFPGNMTLVSRFALTDSNELVLTLQAVSDKPTVCALTNHAYWNLSDGTSIGECELRLSADHYLEVNAELIPSAIASVEGTRYDFRTSHPFGHELYDHHFLFNGTAGPQAEAYSPASGRTMAVTADLPGAQLFTFPKFGVQPPEAGAFCIEPQFNPDSPHHPEWPSVVLRPGEMWNHEIRIAFGVK